MLLAFLLWMTAKAFDVEFNNIKLDNSILLYMDDVILPYSNPPSSLRVTASRQNRL
jgi:hypothetical protein